jgi:hypothetical protein
MQRICFVLAVVTIGLAGAVVSNASGTSRPTVTCSADSAKSFAPPLTVQEICDRFKRAIGRKAGTIRVQLRFSPKGLASANASQLRKGRWKAFPLFEIAVMDRHFNSSDIDRLAGDVMRGIAAAP